MFRKLSDTKPPRGVLRWLLRLPIWLYRMRMGWLLGERFLMLTHIGRKSGQCRQSVLEVIGHADYRELARAAPMVALRPRRVSAAPHIGQAEARSISKAARRLGKC